MPTSFVFLVVFLIIQTYGTIWRTQIAFYVESCAVLNLPCPHPLLSSLCPCMQRPCAAMVQYHGWHREHEEWHALCWGAHDAHCLICLAAVPERFHFCQGPSGILHDKLIACPLAGIPGQQPGPAGKAPPFFNAISFLSGLFLMHICMRTISYALMCLCCLVALCTCVHIKHWCPVACTFGLRLAPPYTT